jgi:hypothetical protein
MSTALMAYTRFSLDRSTPSLWRVTFNNPPINLIDSVMIGELRELFAEVERDQGPTALVFAAPTPTTFWRTTTSRPPTVPSSTHCRQDRLASILGSICWFG